MMAGIENHHSGNWKITVSAHSSFSCSATISALWVPCSKACFESSVERQNSPTGGALLSSASKPAFQRMA
jgi:hypothetical protein